MRGITDRALVATHIPLLTRVFDKSEGDVLEVGTGYFSTLLLHWLATIKKRHVYSYESREHWYNRAKKFESKYHHIVFCANWDWLPERHYGMIFIDHGPNARRIIEIERFKDLCDYMVIHDTQPIPKNKNLPTDYHYEKMIGMFKYRYDYTDIEPWTSVVSNTHPVDIME
jgi:hypothetical protein